MSISVAEAAQSAPFSIQLRRTNREKNDWLELVVTNISPVAQWCVRDLFFYSSKLELSDSEHKVHQPLDMSAIMTFDAMMTYPRVTDFIQLKSGESSVLGAGELNIEQKSLQWGRWKFIDLSAGRYTVKATWQSKALPVYDSKKRKLVDSPHKVWAGTLSSEPLTIEWK